MQIGQTSDQTAGRRTLPQTDRARRFPAAWFDRRGRGGRRLAPALLFPGLIVLLGATVLFNIGAGGVNIAPPSVIAILLDRAHLGFVTDGLQAALARVGLDADVSYTDRQANVLMAIRLPRVVLAGLIGAGLAVSGAALQGVFRNPLADPGLIGVSSGAAVGAIGSIVFGLTLFGQATQPLIAFAFGLLTTLLIYVLARHDGRTEVVTLILTGVALNAIAGAAVGMMTFVADDNQLRDITFWSLGSVGGATWSAVRVVTPFILVGIVAMPLLARSLDLLVLGEREAGHLGVSTERVRLTVIVLTAAMTGASVAVGGAIGFVGLVVPHIIRLLTGPGHRVLLPASALAGAALLMAADLAARTVAIPAELPLGVITALVGGPFFLWLLHQTRRSQGGWG